VTERTLPAPTAPAAAPTATGAVRTDSRPARRGHPTVVLITLLTCQLMLILDVTVMNVAVPRIREHLHFSATSVSWVLNSYTLVFGGLLLLGGRAGDLIGRRKLFVGGVALFTLASLAGGLATSAAWLVTARIVQGLGAAAAGPNTLALITTTFTETRARIRALALFSAMASGGFAIGLLVGGTLTEWLSWRWVLFINVPVGAVATVLAARYVPEPERHRGRLDLPGAVTATTGVAALVYAFIHAASDGWGSGVTLAALAVGLVALAAFLILEAHTRQPLMPLWLFGDGNRLGAYANFFLGPMAMMSSFFFLTQYLQGIRDFSPLRTGFAFLPMAAGMFGMTRVIPRLLPRLGPRPLAVTGSLLMVTGLAWLTQLTPHSGYFSALFGPMLVMGIGGGLGFAPLNVVIMSSVPPKDAGAAGGVLQTMQQVGSTLGLAVLVTIFGTATRHAAHHGSAPDHATVSGMTTVFAVATAMAFCTVLVASTFRRPAPA
jgi:EmrB/QacA subfamily drug resistance transporter